MNKFLFIFLAIMTLTFQPTMAIGNDCPYDYSDTYSIPIELSIVNKISTKFGINEGQQLDFRVRKDVIHNGYIIAKAGDIVQARVENVISSGMNGFPAEITIDNFEFPNIKKTQLISTYTDKGMNRCYWVYPLKWALTPIPFVGTFTNFIKGGHAKIKPSEVITVYYYPNWK